jgi:hypothetical protein
MVRLCLAVVSGTTKTPDPTKALRHTLEKRVATYQPYFRPLPPQ